MALSLKIRSFNPSRIWHKFDVFPWAFSKGTTTETTRKTSGQIHFSIPATVSPLHTNLQVGNFQRHEGACHQHQARVSLQPALHLLLLVVLQPTISHLPFLLPSVSLLACPLDASPWMPAVVLYYCTFQGTVLADWKYFLYCLCLFLCIICMKSIINWLHFFLLFTKQIDIWKRIIERIWGITYCWWECKM